VVQYKSQPHRKNIEKVAGRDRLNILEKKKYPFSLSKIEAHSVQSKAY
jgi:hypothetical protein